MVTKLYSFSLFGLETIKVEIEVDIQTRSPDFEIIGLPSTAVIESKKRIESAIRNSNFHFPGKRIIVNLAPAGIKKMGTLFDLPIAIGILSDEDEFYNLEDKIIVGELSLDGNLRPISGGLPIAIKAAKMGFKEIICPERNANELSIIENIDIIPVKTLIEAIDYLKGKIEIKPWKNKFSIDEFNKKDESIDMSDVIGQEVAKRGLEICAAGGHNLLMIGPPGTGKSMLAKRLPTILPPLTMEEALETTMIYSVAGILDPEFPLVTERPFRSPHHTASDISIIGGGKYPRPGEISLAHNGVLFLDEINLFKSNVLQVLRQPLEDYKITISRAEGSSEFPANFIFVSALNPSKQNNDLINVDYKELNEMFKKISGPLLDRIDIHVNVSMINYEKFESKTKRETSREIRERVIKARKIQNERLKKHKILTNSQMSHKLIEKYCILSNSAKILIKNAMDKFLLSIRSYDKILKVARTIADLENCELIEDYHISEALQYRILDRYLNRFN